MTTLASLWQRAPSPLRHYPERSVLILCAVGFFGVLASLPHTNGGGQLAGHAMGISHPLAVRSDVVGWPVFAHVQMKQGSDGTFHPAFGDAPAAFDGKTIRVQGYMQALEVGTHQKHFLVSRDSPSCPYCLADGPDQMVEVFADKPVESTLDAVVVSGKLELVKQRDNGMFYRLHNATSVD